MSMFPTKILLAVDGSEEAESAARAGIELSEKTGSELHVTHAAPLPTTLYVPESLDYVQEMAEQQGRRTMDEQLEKTRELGGEVAEEHLAIGRPDAGIVRVSEEIGAGLLVVGSRGLGFMRRALLGSVSGSVVHHAHCPVLVVRHRENGEGLLGNKILAATDGSEEARMATGAARELAAATGSELHLIYAPEVGSSAPFLVSREQWETALEQVKQEAQRFVAEQAEQLEDEIEGDAGVSVQHHVRFGSPGREIVNLGEELGVDLTIVGSRGLGGIRRARMGSVSDDVVRHAHCSVLVVRQ